MSLLRKAQDALSLIREGRKALATVVDSVRDGSEAISTTDQAELDKILAEEAAESRAAHDSLEEAIKAAEARNG